MDETFGFCSCFDCCYATYLSELFLRLCRLSIEGFADKGYDIFNDPLYDLLLLLLTFLLAELSLVFVFYYEPMLRSVLERGSWEDEDIEPCYLALTFSLFISVLLLWIFMAVSFKFRPRFLLAFLLFTCFYPSTC